MKLGYFEQFIQEGQLYVPRVDKLGEPLEGSFCTPADTVEQAEFRKSFMQQTFYVSCWHIAEHESDMLWSSYLKDDDGLAIHTTIGQLLKMQPKAFEWLGYEVIPAPLVGNVQYVDHTKIGAFPADDCSLFYKDLAFAGDKEFRLVYKFWSYELQSSRLTKRPLGIKIGLDANLVNGIVLKNGSKLEIFKAVSELTNEVNPQISVVRSRLDRSGNW